MSQPEQQQPAPLDDTDLAPAEVHLVRPSRFGAWLENFWYHYKVPTLILLVLLVVLTVSIVQCATRPDEPDYILCYAGGGDLYPSTSNTVAADMAASTEALLTARDLTGEDVEIYHYRIRSASAVDTALDPYDSTNAENLQNEFLLANTYLFLLSEDVFTRYTATESGRCVVPVADYLPTGAPIETTADGYGVYLRSTPLAGLAGFRELPSDTVLCLRVSYVAFSGGRNAETYARYEALFRAMLSD